MARRVTNFVFLSAMWNTVLYKTSELQNLVGSSHWDCTVARGATDFEELTLTKTSLGAQDHYTVSVVGNEVEECD